MNIRVARFLFVFGIFFFCIGITTDQERFLDEPISVPAASLAVAAVEEKQTTLAPVVEIRKEEPQDATAPVPVAVKSAPAKRSLLEIPALGVSAPVRAMGLDGGKMAVPNNYTEVGWYSHGTVPGAIGNAVMGAHVNNGGFKPSIDGVFKNLKSLKAGDLISSYFEAGEKVVFAVEKVEVYPYNLANTQEVFGSDGRARLVLITCHGTWLPEANTYAERVIVFAERVE